MLFQLGPEQITQYGQTLLSLGLVLFLGLTVYLLIQRGLDIMRQRRYISVSIQGGLQVVLRWVIAGMVILIGLQQIGVQVSSIWAALSAVVVFIGVGLVAVWSVASNIFCSILLLVFRPFSIGDKIEILEVTGGPGLKGKVVNLNLLYTFLHEQSENGTGDTVVQIPNNIFFQKTIRRWQGTTTKSLDQVIFKNDSHSVRQNAAL